MITQKEISNLFRMYVGKHFSERGRAVFGRWLLSESNRVEKEAELERFWSGAVGEVSEDTWEDLFLLRSKIDGSKMRAPQVDAPQVDANASDIYASQSHSSQQHVSSVRSLYRVYLRFAAVVALFIVSIGFTYYFASRSAGGPSIEMAQVFVPYGETREVTLPDSSRVWLNAGSSIVYANSFDNLSSRSVYLTGEASFSVTKNKEKPFIVRTPKMDVEALGTVFIVESYPEKTFTTVTLEEGKIKVGLPEKDCASHILHPSEQLVYSHSDGSVQHNRVDLERFKLCREGYLIFNDTSFQEIVSTLEKRFGVIIYYNASRYGKELYNLKFTPNESLEDVMDILRLLVGVDYRIVNNNVIIK